MGRIGAGASLTTRSEVGGAFSTAGFQPAVLPPQQLRRQLCWAKNAVMMHAGWRSRGYLPHYDGAGATQHVVFGLADAFPHESEAPHKVGERFSWRERHLDRGAGECLLKGPAAETVEISLLHFDGLRYALRGWCVMPNHVHVLLVTAHMQPMSRIVHSWKSFTANRINALHGRSGRLWRREYYDHHIRDEDEFQTA